MKIVRQNGTISNRRRPDRCAHNNQPKERNQALFRISDEIRIPTRRQAEFLRLFQPTPAPTCERQRVRVKVIVSERRFSIFNSETRSLILLKKDRHPAFNRWTSERQYIHLLNSAIKWVRHNLPDASISMPAPCLVSSERKEALAA